MSYISLPDELDEPKKQPALKYSETPYVGATVDSRLEPINTISSYISGSRWVVDYYKQILGRDDVGSTHSDASLKVHKQYMLVRGVPIIVSQDLQASQNSDGQRSFEMTGSGSVIYDITPVEGDVIVADIGDGREMEFTVTSTERASIYPEAYIDISYKAVRVIDAKVRNELDSRVKDTLFYSVDNQRVGLKALLTSTEVEAKERLRKLYHTLTKRYIRDFVSSKYSTLIVPGHGGKTYDPYLTKFFKAIVDSNVYPELHEINLMNMNGDDLSEDETIWDCILDVDLTSLPLIASKVGMVSVNEYRTRPLFNSIFFSGLEQVVRIKDPGYSVNTVDRSLLTSGRLVKSGTQTNDIKDLIPITDLNDTKIDYTDTGDELPMVLYMHYNDHYVFSKEFYESKRPATILERLLIDRIDRGIMDNELLAKIAEYSLRFDNLERFYYTPVILALIKLSDGVI